MAGRSLEDLKRLQRNQLKYITEDGLTEAILSMGGLNFEAAARLVERLPNIANEIAGLKQVMVTSETAVYQKLQDMQQKLDKQAEIIMKPQVFLEQIDHKERETNLVVLGRRKCTRRSYI